MISFDRQFTELTVPIAALAPEPFSSDQARLHQLSRGTIRKRCWNSRAQVLLQISRACRAICILEKSQFQMPEPTLVAWRGNRTPKCVTLSVSAFRERTCLFKRFDKKVIF
jgi:hypothetical protein